MKRRLIVYILLAILSAPVFSQGKEIEVRIGTSIWPSDQNINLHVVRIETGSDGIIQSIKQALPSGDVDLATIKRTSDGSIVITRPSDDPCTIKVEGSALYLSGPYLVDAKLSPLKVAILPEKDVIYDSRVSELKQVASNTLVEKLKNVPNNASGYRLYGNTLFVDYKYTNNVQWKYEFVKRGDVTYATYFYHMGPGLSDDDFNEYSPPIEIRGPRLFRHDIAVNVINHFILVATETILPDVLFRSNFLSN